MGVKHAKVSAKPDGADPTLVQASDWNDDHVITGVTDEYLVRIVGGNVVQAPGAYYTAFNNQYVFEKRVLISANLNEATVSGGDPSLTVATSGTNLTQHDGGAQSFCTQHYNLDVGAGGAASAIAQGFLADASATKTGAGPLINSAFVGGAANGTDNYCFQGLVGTGRFNDDVVIGDSLTVGSGTAAASGETLLHTKLTVDNGLDVSLGNKVANFVVPGDASTSPCIAVGAAATGAAQVNTKNMVAVNADAGYQALLDTTVNANVRGGFVAYRGASGGFGGANQIGFVYAGSNDVYIIGATANDLCLFNTASGKRMLLSSDGSGFTVGASLNAAGQFAAKSLMTGDPGAGTGAKWTRGTSSPEGVVTGNKGDLFSRTDGGAATCLYVKETTGGSTGWVAK